MMEVSSGTSPFSTHRPPTEMYKDARLAEMSANLHSSARANQLRQPTQRIALFHTPVLVLLSLALRQILQSVTFPPLFYIRRTIRSLGYRCHKLT